MPKLPRGECPRCGKVVALRVNGTLREHNGEWPIEQRWPSKCPGSGEQPKYLGVKPEAQDALFRVVANTGAHVTIALFIGRDPDHRQNAGEIRLKPDEWEALKRLLTAPTPPLEVLRVTISE